LVLRKIEVIDIISEKNSKHHILTSFAKIDCLTITYCQESAIGPDERSAPGTEPAVRGKT
jgi:hypothetical protein